jgi:hypothetical protein
VQLPTCQVSLRPSGILTRDGRSVAAGSRDRRRRQIGARAADTLLPMGLRMVCWRVFVSFVWAGAAVALLGVAAGTARASGLSWLAPVLVDANGNGLNGVSCPSASLCVAVDGAGTALISTDPAAASPSWSRTEIDSGVTNGLTGVSCPSTSLCVAVDGAGRAVISTDPAGGVGAWSAAAVDGGEFYCGYHGEPGECKLSLSGVSCPSASLCVAVDSAGNAVITTNPTATTPTWGSPTLIDPPDLVYGDIQDLAVSCASTSLCVAVDDQGNVVITTNPTAPEPRWRGPTYIDGGNGDLIGVSCPSTSLCVAVDGSGSAIVTTDPTAPKPSWRGPTDIDGTNPLQGVSCASVSLCAAVDSVGHVVIATPPSTARIKANLRGQITPHGSAAGIAELLKKHGYGLSFTALSGGKVVIDWYYVPHGGHIASAKPVLVAVGRATFAYSKPLKIMIKLTADGEQLLKHSTRVTVTARGTFTPIGGHAVVATKQFRLTR